MDIFVVQGGRKLEGSITVGGAKNAAVAIIPAAILSGDICRIENLPTISDVEVISKILVQLGAKVNRISSSVIEIDSRELSCAQVSQELAKNMRASYYMLGALLGRFGKARVPMPGGCYFGAAVELVEKNLEILRRKAAQFPEGSLRLQAVQGDATDLAAFPDGAFDVALSFGPMYHLYEPEEVRRTIRETIRVTKDGGVMMFAFLSVYAILFDNYLKDTLHLGMEENFDEAYRTKHFAEQLFTGYDIVEFEELFRDEPVEHLATAATDTVMELAEQRVDFSMTDEHFEEFLRYHLATCEKRELLGASSHLLYICKKIGK